MNNSSEDGNEGGSNNSFGEYRPYSEGSRTQHGITNTTQHTSPAPETREEDKDVESSSDTANFFPSSQAQNMSFDPDFASVVPAPLPPVRMASVSNVHNDSAGGWEWRNDSSVSDNPYLVRSRPLALPILPPVVAPDIPVLPRPAEHSPPPESAREPLFEERAEEILDDVVYLSNKESANLRDTKSVLTEQRQSFEEYRTKEQQRISSEKELWEANMRKAQSLFCPETDLFELDVGGTHKIVSTRATFCKSESSALAAMFSGRHKLRSHKGKVFIDRDGEAFCMMMSYLRNDRVPVFASKSQEDLFYEELDYWQIPVQPQPAMESPQEFDPMWCASTLRFEAGHSIVRKNGPQHGVVFCKQPMGLKRAYVEFRVTARDRTRGKSSLFVGLVDRARYRPEQLVSTFWRDSPSSFYCDVWNNKLVKIDEKGCQSGVSAGYGCECQDAEVTCVGAEYSEKDRTLAFYKNGVCQGVAFHNVPTGLYPAVDLWFETGHVEVLSSRTQAGTGYNPLG